MPLDPIPPHNPATNHVCRNVHSRCGPAEFAKKNLTPQGNRISHESIRLHFFFQAEDGIRDRNVTGVQTCALPICGGTLISFPALVWLGLPAITANATSTVAIWPGSLGSIWGFRSEFGQVAPKLKWLSISSVIGGGIGAILLRSTPAVLFERLVPFLILFATILFIAETPIQKKLRERNGTNGIGMTAAVGLTLFVAIYGGYFGAGMSIMMLSSLRFVGMTDLLQRNALTSLF